MNSCYNMNNTYQVALITSLASVTSPSLRPQESGAKQLSVCRGLRALASLMAFALALRTTILSSELLQALASLTASARVWRSSLL